MRVVPLKKDPEYDPEKGNFRPIAIMNGNAKVIETQILKEIENVEYEYQHGFTKGKSTETAHIKLAERMSRNKDANVIFVDLKDAYNTVLRGKLLKIMKLILTPNAYNTLEDEMNRYRYRLGE